MQLDQALFGYSQGHRRLTSSFGMPQQEERLLVRMTDLSGSRIAEGFDNYLSGYSLGQSGRYVIAKTWYAPECERPGCVWTQVLFITPDVWDAISAVDVLAAFRRPENLREELDWYSRKLEISQHTSNVETDWETRQVLCDAVYLSGRATVALSSNGNKGVDAVVLKMLWQRPAPFREAFSFCTGALSFLKLEERPLRLQVMPSRAGRSLREQDADVVLLDTLNRATSDATTAYIARELEEEREEYRGFLAGVTRGWAPVEEPDGSLLMFDISEAFLLRQGFWEGHVAEAEMFERVAALQSDAGSRLMQLSRVLLNELRSPSASWFYVERALAGKLNTHKFGSEFTREAARTAALQDPRKALDVILRHLSKEVAAESHAEITTGLLGAIDLSFLSTIRPIEPQILVLWSKLHPNELADSRFWLLQHSFGESAEIAEALAETFSEGLILQALVRADRFDLVLSLLRAQGREGAVKAFDLARDLNINLKHDRLMLNALRDEITVHADYVTHGESREITPGQLFLLGSTHLDAARLFSLARQPSVWLEVLEALNGRFDRLHVTGFELAVVNHGWWHVAELAFVPLYVRTAAREIAYEEWSVLKRVLPKIGGWEKWDKCERLRRALINVLRRDGVSLAKLSLIDDEIMWQLRKTESKYHGDW